MKHFLTTVAFLICVTSNAQNPSFRIIFDSITPIVQRGDYAKAKEIWQDLDKKYDTDPQEKFHFLFYSLENDDVKYFKKEMKVLAKESGLNYSLSDTNELLRTEEVEKFMQHGVYDWVVKMSSKYYHKWIYNSPIAFKTNLKVQQALLEDQFLTGNFHGFIQPDSLGNLDSISTELNHFIHRQSFGIIADLATYCIEIGTFPNNIDHGLNSYYPLELIIWHNLSSDQNFQMTWDVLRPHIEKAYFDGKISRNLFLLYDLTLYQHTGQQYYGLLADIPIKDSSTYDERKKRFRFDLY